MGSQKNRFEKYVDWALMTLLSVIASYGSHLVGDMSKNLQELNQKVAVVLVKVADQDRRLIRLEKAVFHK